jgi:hypothetical protein
MLFAEFGFKCFGVTSVLRGMPAHTDALKAFESKSNKLNKDGDYHLNFRPILQIKVKFIQTNPCH